MRISADTNLKVRHVEHVKTFAPHVWHIVVDVECRPA
jgi:tRNA G37 N-methylase Trm5